eukprot:TRINITY_DN42079_c0_g1_i1.p1 TRINITY_DN42079_c0_g1~~TRINITY_DN42079_c0_g1_i1.p1  ORF type:complete len:832 (+),score=80.42 TRINITY_DN42079_c0_g1_i1:331-2496(+)
MADVEERYGGIDSILLWPTYTNIGIDARNQFDYFRALPGGLQGLSDLTTQFRARGVHVLWAYNPWDQGTRSEGEPHWDTLARLLKETGGNGFNGDTMTTMYEPFWTASTKIGYPVVGEMEGGGYPRDDQRKEDASWRSANWETTGWGYFRNGFAADNITYAYDVAVGVDKLKWLDSRRMTHVCDRWAKNRTDSLHYAFFNGVGYESWENVWGVFMKFTPRDGEALRRIATLFRWLGRESFIQDAGSWEPYTLDLSRQPEDPFSAGGLMASKFTHREGGCVWLVVNRASKSATAELNTSRCVVAGEGLLFDLYHGTRLAPTRITHVQVEPHGYGAVLLTTLLPSGLQQLLRKMQHLTQRPLQSYSAAWKPLQQEMIPPSANRRVLSSTPPGTVLIPRTNFHFRTAGVELEGGCDLARDTWGVCCKPRGNEAPHCPDGAACATPCAFLGEDSRGVDAQFPWEPMPGRFHERLLDLGPFFIDMNLVTKGDYAQFLDKTGYKPRDSHNYLADWKHPLSGEGGFPQPVEGSEKQPVVWLSLHEARMYCGWAGKRLPHTYEWQLAAQGTDGRLFPWGSHPGAAEAAGHHFPLPSNNSAVPSLPDVGAFSPQGDSPYGVADLVGHVWQYTDEFRDEHTRTVLLKGSSLYTPMLSSRLPALPQYGNWYFPKAQELDRHNRMMLMDDSYERAGTLGFRCVADHVDGAPAPFHFRDLEAEEAGPSEQIVYF